ncbi:long-chain-fatty-acid--CoA ligase [Alteraurantiacibacter buctensis]|uniref:AMP-binding protein n=1 Tax=Alteraurantiacibacter buctensis TaxID=1503981 RepID=A0A844YXB0_9SPHN|nr:AMP-binding protein [Alteraurantiacibacter buctensis]
MSDVPVPWHFDENGEHVFPPRLLTDLIDHAVARWPGRNAIDYYGRCWSYAEIGALVERAARGLQDAGMQPGDRFGLCLGNSPYHVVLYFAALRIGLIVVNLNPLYTEPEMIELARDAGIRMVAVPEVRFVHEKVEQLADEAGIEKLLVCRMRDILPWHLNLGFRLLRRADHIRVTRPDLTLELADLLANAGKPDPVERHPDDVAVLQYTGGTTGLPKGAMLTHASLAANCAQMLAHFGGHPVEQQRTLGVLPMFHVFALTSVLNFTIETGAELVLLPRFVMKEVLAAAKRKPPTQIYGVPTMWAAFNALPENQVPDFSSVYCAISGGAPLPLEVRTVFEARTKTRVVEGYGLSEASPIITCNPLFGLVKADSAGPRFPGTIIEIRDPENPAHVCSQGERGEVMARGPQLMKGYWNNPQATEATFYHGALRTGDIGYLDEDGYLFLVDRIKDLILRGGYNVYPRVIEDAAYEHPDVREAIAIAIPHPMLGQVPKLFIAARPGSDLTVEGLREFLATRINKIEMPTEFEFRDSLPKTMIGKLSKKELVEEEKRKRA